MAIRFHCEHCKARVKVPDGSQGRRMKCPRCGHLQRVPAGEVAPSSESAPAATSAETGEVSPDTGAGAVTSPSAPEADEQDDPVDALAALAHAGDESAVEPELAPAAQPTDEPVESPMPPPAPEPATDAPNEPDQPQATPPSPAGDDSPADSPTPSDTPTSETDESSTPPTAQPRPRPQRPAGPPEPIALAGRPAPSPSQAEDDVPVARSRRPDSAGDVEPVAGEATDAPLLGILRWVLRFAAALTVIPAVTAWRLADSMVAGVAGLILGLAVAVTIWTVGEIAAAMRQLVRRPVPRRRPRSTRPRGAQH